MKTSLFVILIFLTAITGCKSTKPAAGKAGVKNPPSVSTTIPVSVPVNFSDPDTWILGSFKVDMLYQPPYSEWYVRGFDEYKFCSQYTDSLKMAITPDVTIKIVMGTWCPDSRREVPRFMRIMKIIDFPADKVELIGVDNSKIAPLRNFESLDIKRVPTFIIYKNNIEAGRIIENPVTSLEQDMVKILTGMNKN
ncbi:MAG: thioredoxin family protein [Bacteroidales bacterium]|jgi:thiol-disulfide isomerase/thioredoxin